MATTEVSSPRLVTIVLQLVLILVLGVEVEPATKLYPQVSEICQDRMHRFVFLTSLRGGGSEGKIVGEEESEDGGAGRGTERSSEVEPGASSADDLPSLSDYLRAIDLASDSDMHVDECQEREENEGGEQEQEQ